MEADEVVNRLKELLEVAGDLGLERIIASLERYTGWKIHIFRSTTSDNGILLMRDNLGHQHTVLMEVGDDPTFTLFDQASDY